MLYKLNKIKSIENNINQLDKSRSNLWLYMDHDIINHLKVFGDRLLIN